MHPDQHVQLAILRQAEVRQHALAVRLARASRVRDAVAGDGDGFGARLKVLRRRLAGAPTVRSAPCPTC
jgi:hypothetical protein